MNDNIINDDFPQFAWHVHNALSYVDMGIYKIKIIKKASDKHIIKLLEKEAYICEKIELVWWVSDEHKPKIHPSEPKHVRIGKSRIAFNEHQLQEHFDAHIQKILKEVHDNISLSNDNLNYFLKEAAKSSKNISDLQNTIKQIEAKINFNIINSLQNNQNE